MVGTFKGGLIIIAPSPNDYRAPKHGVVGVKGGHGDNAELSAIHRGSGF